MIYKNDDLGEKYGTHYVISSHHVWRPGCYDTERTARYAFRFSDEVLQKLQDEVNEKHSDPRDRVITFEMLQQARRSP